MKEAIGVVEQLIEHRGTVFGSRCASHPKQIFDNTFNTVEASAVQEILDAQSALNKEASGHQKLALRAAQKKQAKKNNSRPVTMPPISSPMLDPPSPPSSPELPEFDPPSSKN